MALGKEPYKELYAADLTALRDLSVMAERVYIHLACGERSSACCVSSCDPEHLRYSVRARRTAEVTDALAELEAAGWLVLDLPMKQAWLPVQARRTWAGSESSATGWRNDLTRFRLSVASRQALNFIDTAPIAPSKGQSSPRPLSNSISSSISNRIPAVAKATATLALPDVTRLALPMEAEPQADEEPAIDWLKVQQEAQDPQTSRRDFRVKPNVTPEAALRIAQADAKRVGILSPEAQQLAMDLPAGKPKRELTPAQLDAIFAKKRLQKVVNEWNEVMAGINAPCDYKAVEKLAGTLMGNLAKYEHRDVFDDASCLFGWAMAVDRYHAGKDLKKWSLQAWLTAEHLALVFATYRANKGDGKLLTLDLDRTIRHWRLGVETAELNNKITEANNAY